MLEIKRKDQTANVGVGSIECEVYNAYKAETTDINEEVPGCY